MSAVRSPQQSPLPARTVRAPWSYLSWVHVGASQTVFAPPSNAHRVCVRIAPLLRHEYVRIAIHGPAYCPPDGHCEALTPAKACHQTACATARCEQQGLCSSVPGEMCSQLPPLHTKNHALGPCAPSP